MKKKKLFLMLLLAPFAMALSQTEDNAEAEGTNISIVIKPITFTYDAVGNRLTRSVVSKVALDSIPGPIVWNVGELGGKTVQLTPRPSQGELTVDIIGYDQTDNCTIGVYDANGHILTTQSINAASTDIQYNRVQNQSDIIHLKLNGETAAWMITDTNN